MNYHNIIKTFSLSHQNANELYSLIDLSTDTLIQDYTEILARWISEKKYHLVKFMPELGYKMPLQMPFVDLSDFFIETGNEAYDLIPVNMYINVVKGLCLGDIEGTKKRLYYPYPHRLVANLSYDDFKELRLFFIDYCSDDNINIIKYLLDLTLNFFMVIIDFKDALLLSIDNNAPKVFKMLMLYNQMYWNKHLLLFDVFKDLIVRAIDSSWEFVGLILIKYRLFFNYGPKFNSHLLMLSVNGNYANSFYLLLDKFCSDYIDFNLDFAMLQFMLNPAHQKLYDPMYLPLDPKEWPYNKIKDPQQLQEDAIKNNSPAILKLAIKSGAKYDPKLILLSMSTNCRQIIMETYMKEILADPKIFTNLYNKSIQNDTTVLENLEQLMSITKPILEHDHKLLNSFWSYFVRNINKPGYDTLIISLYKYLDFEPSKQILFSLLLQSGCERILHWFLRIIHRDELITAFKYHRDKSFGNKYDSIEKILIPKQNNEVSYMRFTKDCAICFETNMKRLVFLPCGHADCCKSCYIQSNMKDCPICMRTITYVWEMKPMILNK